MAQVCMIVHQNYFRDGRVKRYVDTLLRAGVAVDVIGLRSSDYDENDTLEGLRVYTLPMQKQANSARAHLLEYLCSSFLFTIWLLALYARNRYRVIHVHNMPDFLIFTALIPRLLGARLILDIHDPMPEFYMSKYSDHRSDGLMARLMRWQERMSAGLAHVIITANDNFKRNLIQRGISEGKISVVNNLPDTTIFDRDRIVRSNSEKFTLIYPGTIAPRYGLHIAVRAMPLIVDEIPNVQLRIIGGQNDYCVELIDLARELGAAAYIEFHPAIPIAAVPIQMANADIGIYPALPDPHMSIATPSKTLEFALMGLPIVASRLDVLVDMLPEDGVAFIEPGNVEEFAAAVLTLYRDPSARRAMTQIMNEVFVHNHSWEQEAERYMNILAKWIGAVEDTGQQDSPASLRSESPERIL